MAIDFKLPEVGENIEKADIGNVLVKEGDVITADQIVMEVETDKAVFELPCPHKGRVAKVHVKPGDKVTVGTTLLTVDEASGASAAPPAPQPAAPAAAPAKGPASSSAPAPSPAKSVPGAATATVAPPAPAPAAAAARPATTPAQTNGEIEPPPPAGPATRRFARELGVDLHLVTGSGPGGRITTEDVQAYVRDLTSGNATGGGGGVVAPPLPDFTKFGPVERVRQNKVMQTGAAHLTRAWNLIPHVTQHELVDVTDLEAGRKRFQQANASRQDTPKVTMTVLAMKGVVAALKAFPQFNASLDTKSNEVVYKKYYHLGVAVDTENGLVVPVIRDVDTKTLLTLAAELGDVAVKARNRKLTTSDMEGGTFTITNLGGIGGTYFTPIVNYPEVAILGMSRSSWQQVIINGKPETRLMLPLSLSYDHRVINGADAARFIVKLASLLADPFALLSEM